MSQSDWSLILQAMHSIKFGGFWFYLISIIGILIFTGILYGLYCVIQSNRNFRRRFLQDISIKGAGDEPRIMRDLTPGEIKFIWQVARNQRNSYIFIDGALFLGILFYTYRIFYVKEYGSNIISDWILLISLFIGFSIFFLYISHRYYYIYLDTRSPLFIIRGNLTIIAITNLSYLKRLSKKNLYMYTFSVRNIVFYFFFYHPYDSIYNIKNQPFFDLKNGDTITVQYTPFTHTALNIQRS